MARKKKPRPKKPATDGRKRKSKRPLWAFERAGTSASELLEPGSRDAIRGLLRSQLDRAKAAESIELVRGTAHDLLGLLLRQLETAPANACEFSAETRELLERAHVALGFAVQTHPVRGEAAWQTSSEGIADDDLIIDVLFEAEAARSGAQDSLRDRVKKRRLRRKAVDEVELRQLARERAAKLRAKAR